MPPQTHVCYQATNATRIITESATQPAANNVEHTTAPDGHSAAIPTGHPSSATAGYPVAALWRTATQEGPLR